MSKNMDIQVLRGVAILFVILFHLPGKVPAPEYFLSFIKSNGFQVGVELFFVISGFVITNSLMRMSALSRNKYISRQDWLLFWKKRGHRLLPAFIFWVFVGLLFIPIMDISKVDFGVNALFSIYGLIGIYNIVDAYCGAFDLFGTSCPDIEITRVYWSLSLEAQFYAVLSLSLLFVGVRRFLVYSAALFSIFLCIFSYSIWAQDFLYVVYSILIRSCGLFFGCLIALQSSTGQLVFLQKVPKILKCLILIAGIAVIPILGGYDGLVSTLVVSVICYTIVLISTGGNVISGYPVSKWLVWVGERSYSIYLSHVVILYLIGGLIHSIAGINNATLIEVAILTVVFAGIMVTGHFSFTRIEKSFF